MQLFHKIKLTYKYDTTIHYTYMDSHLALSTGFPPANPSFQSLRVPTAWPVPL